VSALSPRQFFLLDEACKPFRAAFGDTPYLVGSAAERGAYRDVDVRLMLEDEHYELLAAQLGTGGMAFLGIAIGQYLASRTDLNIDFQIQKMSVANARFSGSRNPLGTRSLTNYAGDAAEGGHE
jgi:hypothetical protein